MGYRLRRLFVFLIAVPVIFGLTGIPGISTAFAQDGPTVYLPFIFNQAQVANVAIDQTSGVPGTILAVTGKGFPANTTIRVGPGVKGSEPVSFTNVTSSASGTISTNITIPNNAAAGEDWIILAMTEDGSIKALSRAFLVLPLEAILINEPASGSRVTGTIHVTGTANPTFEQNLTVRIIDASGTELALESTTIGADVGQRGPFTIDIPLSLSSEQNIFIQVYATSPRDGEITHLSSVGVAYSPSLPADILTQTGEAEQISIFEPEVSDSIQGGTVHVEGFGMASFEQTLLVEVLDENGDVVGSEPVMVESSTFGEPGPFSADIDYSIISSGPGRIVVRDISPAFGGDIHRNSVEVNLSP